MSEERVRPDTFPFPGSSSHPLQPGATVTVITLIEGRAPFIESRALSSSRLRRDPTIIWFGFPAIRRSTIALCIPHTRKTPTERWSGCLELWRASYEPALHDEFFPDHPQTKGV